MKKDNHNLVSKSTYQASAINETLKLKKGCESNTSDDIINIDPYLLSIKLKKAIPSIDQDISDLNQTICHLIYSNKANEAKRGRSKSKKVTTKPPIDSTNSDREKLDDEKNNLKFDINRLSREAKFELEKLRSRKNDRSFNRIPQDRSKPRKFRAQSSEILEPNFNFNFLQDKISDSNLRGISVHSRTRLPSNLRASSKTKIKSSRHNILIEDKTPDFPIPLLNESSDFLILPPKHYHIPHVEKLSFSNSKFKHHHSHKPSEPCPVSNQIIFQQSEQPSQNFLSNQLNEATQHQFYPHAQTEQSNQHFFNQNEQFMQMFPINQPNEPNHLYPQSQIPQQINQQMPQQINQQMPQQINQQMPQLSQQQIAQVGQQIQVDLNPQQAQLFLNSNPAQQAEIIGKIQQQVLGSQIPIGTQAEVQIQPQLNQQPINGLSSIQQLEMTLQQLQNLYINPNVQQFQHQNQQPDMGMQYLGLQSQNQTNDIVNKSQQSTQQQIQNYLNLQQQQKLHQTASMYNQNQSQQYYNVLPQDIQATGSQPQNQQQYILAQNTSNTPIGLKSSKVNMNFLGMMLDPSNQSQY